MKSRLTFLPWLLTGLLILIPACSSDDDDNGGTNPPPPTYDDPVLEVMATECSEVAQGLIDQFPAWVQGITKKKEMTDPVWNEECMCWRWSITEGDNTNPQHNWSRAWYFSLTYFAEDTPQQEIADADRIQVVVNYSYFSSKQQNEQNNSYTEFYLNITMNTTEFTQGSATVSGSGTGSFNGYFTVNGEFSEAYRNMDVVLNLTMPLPSGCPTGAFELDMDTTHFSIGFDGTSTGYWDYVYGPGQFEDGELHFSCGK